VLSEQDISNKELANRLGVTEGTVSTWCRNFKQPKTETLFEIAKALEVESSTLINTIGKAGS
jgi:transcriptional regulator with XRE-family HTH domain